MPFRCPKCSSPGSLGIIVTIELPPDASWDEITLQVIRCKTCHFSGVAVYRESRRGALKEEIIHHMGYSMQDKDLKVLERMIRNCPKPSNWRCDCPVHRKLGSKDDQGRWNGLSGMGAGHTFDMKLG